MNGFIFEGLTFNGRFFYSFWGDHFRKALDEAGREAWLSTRTYWKVRKEPGFAYTDNLDLW